MDLIFAGVIIGVMFTAATIGIVAPVTGAEIGGGTTAIVTAIVTADVNGMTAENPF